MGPKLISIRIPVLVEFCGDASSRMVAHRGTRGNCPGAAAVMPPGGGPGMPEDLRKSKTDEILARVKEVIEQAQSLRTDISRQMDERRKQDRSVTQPLSPRKPRKRHN
jgi:hypothetical protein